MLRIKMAWKKIELQKHEIEWMRVNTHNTHPPECEWKNERKLGKQKYTQTLNESENTNEKESALQGKTNK